MKSSDIENIQKVAAEIQNFKTCYEGCELWGRREDSVSAEQLIEFLIEHPEFQQIANTIKKYST